MRIVSGRARGKRLSSFTGTDIRPTPDRVREAIFSILFSRLGSFNGLRVLDLFAGSGAMALEALSRGCANALLVDNGPDAARIVPANITLCGMEGVATFRRQDVLKALGQINSNSCFDLIFLDPPYNKGLAEKTVQLISEQDILSPEGIICAETEKGESLPESFGRLRRIESRIYGSTSVHLYHYPNKGTQ